MGCGASKRREVQVEALPQKAGPPADSGNGPDHDPEVAKARQQQISKAQLDRREEGSWGSRTAAPPRLLTPRPRPEQLLTPVLPAAQPRA